MDDRRAVKILGFDRMRLEAKKSTNGQAQDLRLQQRFGYP